MKIYLRDLKTDLIEAWRQLFAGDPNVDVSFGDIFAEGEHMNVDAIVSPSNSFGYMDGGIDYVYSMHFGWEVQLHLQDHIQKEFQGELLVGQAAVIDMHEIVNKKSIRYLISAPTMRTPCDVSNTVNAYLAFVAALRVADQHPEINSVLCPGLGTAIGKMPAWNCAIQMHAAWKRYNNPKFFDCLGTAHMDHHLMMTPAAYMKNLIRPELN